MSAADQKNSWKRYVVRHQERMMRSSHIDFRIRKLSEDDARLDYVLDPQNIIRHPFYPFVKFTKNTRRYKKLDDGSGKRQCENKPRDICYASHKDALVYSWYGWMLADLYEQYLAAKDFAESVLAYRYIPRKDGSGRGKSNIHFAKDVFDAIKEMGECTVFPFVVKKFFPRFYL
jgi:hypothetical protein